MKSSLLLLGILFAASAWAGPSGTINEYHVDISDVVIETGNEYFEIALAVCKENGERYDTYRLDSNNADLIVLCSTGGI